MVRSQEVHHRYQQIADVPALAELERARRDEQIIAQAAELTRVSVKNVSCKALDLRCGKSSRRLDKPEKSKRCGNPKLPNYCAVIGSVKLRWNASAWRPPALKAVIKKNLDLDQKHLRN
ncbi:hypothetical protein H310_09568 [Aphanomyces invadans]|uniref:Uncharacterized protein n=1 Tax=Aphanomyces invadans TaxID=157072 RepID=A0A024TVM8_9STRA|nr:hypothetical protein H310_09568 [Aphanomyces invadans]ETV97681.1 hypothetical protein H310_09568 [Aphanomyces invadans]|eukprot:XP_008873890.1 hypothetical protein H310_09568 [Aphanomyces invadans]